MKVTLITSAAIVMTWFAGSAVAQQSCDATIDIKSDKLKELNLSQQTALDQLSSLRNCASNYDETQSVNVKIEARQNEVATLSQKMNVLADNLDNMLAEIEGLSQQSQGEVNPADLNAKLANRLAYREQVKTFSLRSSPEVQALVTEQSRIESEITALSSQLDDVDSWADREQLNVLVLEEGRLTEALTELQSRLTALRQNRSNPEYDAAAQLQQDGPQRVSALKASVQGLQDQIVSLQDEIVGQEADLSDANTKYGELESLLGELTSQFDELKSQQTKSTKDLAGAQIEKNRLLPILQSLQSQETVLSTNLERMLPQAQATQAIVDQLQASVEQKTEQTASLDSQIKNGSSIVAELEARIDAANQAITSIRNKMTSEYKPKSELENISNQVFALELTIGGLDKEIDNLDMRVSGAEGKLNRFIRACRREPACKAALSL
jgi:predicted RNase H-like nuclease (RuvC/YqgF family)